MVSRKHIRKLGMFGLVIVLAFLGACASGVPQSEYDTAKQQLAAQEQKATTLQQQLSAKEAELASSQQQIAAKEKELAELQQQTANATSAPQTAGPAGGVFTLIGAQIVPTPAPPPTPTPLPPGATPPPRPTPPASLYEPVGPFAFYVETLATTRPSKYGLASTVSCIPTSVFKRGMKIVWRFEVIDLSTGKRVTDVDEATVKVVLPQGEELTARFSQRGGGSVPSAPWMWNTFWDIPTDYPLGAFDYSIVVTGKDGRTGTFKPPALVSQERGIDSRLQIID